jgi:hypothetical protein
MRDSVQGAAEGESAANCSGCQVSEGWHRVAVSSIEWYATHLLSSVVAAGMQFISAMKPIARDLEKSGAVSFSPHYLLWSW